MIRDQVIQVRLSSAELAMLQADAGAARLPLVDYVRAVLLPLERRQQPASGADSPVAARRRRGRASEAGRG